MTCKCGSNRILEVNAKCGDGFNCFQSDTLTEFDGYVPSVIGLGNDSDCTVFSYCLDCGQIQDFTPVPKDWAKSYMDD